MEWAEKYRPEHLADIVGNTSAIRQMADWARTWTSRSKPLLLYGKPGIGKTSSVYALARDMNWDVIEANASDQRTAAVIERIAGAGSTTASLTGSLRKLIVMDEADNLQGNADRGGARAIIECIKNARQPMILIANDLYGLARNSACAASRYSSGPSRHARSPPVSGSSAHREGCLFGSGGSRDCRECRRRRALCGEHALCLGYREDIACR